MEDFEVGLALNDGILWEELNDIGTTSHLKVWLDKERVTSFMNDPWSQSQIWSEIEWANWM